MAGRPGLDPTEEGKSYSALFVLLVAVLLVSAVWSIWDDNISRRPWKQYQVQWDHLAYDKYMNDAADEQKRLNADPDISESIEGPGRSAEAARLRRDRRQARRSARAVGRSQQHRQRQRSAGAVHQVVSDRAMVRLQPRRSVQAGSGAVQSWKSTSSTRNSRRKISSPTRPRPICRRSRIRSRRSTRRSTA